MHTSFMQWVTGWCLAVVLHDVGVSALPSKSTANNKDVSIASQVPEGAHYRTEALEPRFSHKLKSRRVKVSYPATYVPPMTINEGMGGFEEMSTYLPCKECLILSMEADVEYRNGTQASPASSFWLHHAVFVNRGKVDHFCGPSSWGQRFFAVGNERTRMIMSSSGKHVSGYHIESSDTVALSVDLMNMSPEPQEVIFSTTYEFIEKIPKKFVSTEPVWLDIGGCQSSAAPAKPDTTFELSSPSWSSSFSGKVISAGAHLHDGGTHLHILKNGHVVCEAIPKYQTYPSHSGDTTVEHISEISTCSDIAKVTTDDKWTINAYYNTSLHKPMLKMDGSLEPVMGISLIYIARDRGGCDRKGSLGFWHLLEHRNLILPLSCLVFGSLLAVAWLRQNRNTRRLQWLLEHPKMSDYITQDLKLPLTQYGSN